MNIEACRVKSNVSRITLAERGRKTTFVNPSKDEYIKTRYDGCVVTNELAADYVVSKSGIGCVIVELKGRNVEHAVKQIEATASFWMRERLCCGQLAALIIAKHYPRSSPSVLKAKGIFYKKYKAHLHIVTKNEDEFKFERVLSASGPR